MLSIGRLVFLEKCCSELTDIKTRQLNQAGEGKGALSDLFHDFFPCNLAYFLHYLKIKYLSIFL